MVNTEDDFQWLSQLRYYWEEDNLITRMINSQLAYGYEYLGNSSRLASRPSLTAAIPRCSAPSTSTWAALRRDPKLRLSRT